jgi:transposase
LKRAEAAGLRWPLPDDWDDERIERSLFTYGQHRQRPPERAQPDFESIHEQLKQHSNLTLALLWEEYRRAQSDGYRYSRFCELYQRWRRKQETCPLGSH